MKLQARIAMLLALGAASGCCLAPVNEMTDGGDAGPGAADSGPRIDGGRAGCTIVGSSYTAGDVDPLHPCQLCDPATSTSHWTYAPDRSSCGSGRYCFDGSCENACAADDGGVVPPTTSDLCRFCGESGSWTPLADGLPCMFPGKPSTEALFCFNGACVLGCNIGGTYYSPSARNPQNSCEWCGAQDGYGWSNVELGFPCGDGGICDLNGQCGPPFCAITSPSGTLEEFPSRSSNPADPSLCCNPALTFNDWSPRLQLSQTLAIDGDSRDFAAGDFNGDGWMDLAVIAGGASASLTIFMNQQGILQASQVSTIASSSVGIAAADLNGDGFDDVILGDAQAQTISVWTSRGNGNFSQPVAYTAGPITHGDLQCADFNGDGIPDVISGAATVLYFQGRGDGSGLMAPATINDQPAFQVRFAVGDLNGDHTPDVTLLSFMGSEGNIEAQLGSGNGGFTPKPTPANVDLNPDTLDDLVEGDLDGDGFRDLAITVFAGPGATTRIGTFQGFGDGTFGQIDWAPPPPSPLSNIEGLAIGDLEGDGNKVLFAVMVLDANQSVWKLYEYNVVTGSLMPLLKNAVARWPVLADFNHDNATDVVGAGDPNVASPTLAIYLNGCP